MTEQRRARLQTRHLLDGSATSAVEAARAVALLHATDPATVYLSVLARAHGLALDDVAGEMYVDRALVRMMGMRRTLFVAPLDLAPTVHHAAALDVAATMRKRIIKELQTAPTDPPMPDDVGPWLADVEAGVEHAVERLGVASGAQIGAAEPRLRTAILPRTDKTYDIRRTITTQVLALMGAEGKLVRGEPLGSWTSRQHTWESATTWWPDGIPEVEDARTRLVATYLRRFGPATERDVAWWTGWALGITRRAIAGLDTAHLPEGLLLADDTDPLPTPEPVAALLPALDPTPMGWKQREWFLPEDSKPLYDPNGNIGPSVWWAGEVIGAWATRQDGSIAWRLLADRGRDAASAIEKAAERLAARLGRTVVVPSFRTPLERELGR